jgi:hypothetical protein
MRKKTTHLREYKINNICILYYILLYIMERKYKFVESKSDMHYNPDKKLFKYYQICHFRNPKTSKYHIRKILYNQNAEVVNMVEKSFTMAEIKKFFEIHKENEYKTYNTYDLSLVQLPTGAEIMMAQSPLINTEYKEYDFAPAN